MKVELLIVHMFSQFISSVEGQSDHSPINDCMNKTGNHLFYCLLIDEFIFDFVVNY